LSALSPDDGRLRPLAPDGFTAAIVGLSVRHGRTVPAIAAAVAFDRSAYFTGHGPLLLLLHRTGTLLDGLTALLDHRCLSTAFRAGFAARFTANFVTSFGTGCAVLTCDRTPVFALFGTLSLLGCGRAGQRCESHCCGESRQTTGHHKALQSHVGSPVSDRGLLALAALQELV